MKAIVACDGIALSGAASLSRCLAWSALFAVRIFRSPWRNAWCQCAPSKRPSAA